MICLAALAGVLVCTPMPTQAQLRTFCLSPTQDFCAHILSWGVAYQPGQGPGGIAELDYTYELFGGDVPAGPFVMNWAAIPDQSVTPQQFLTTNVMHVGPSPGVGGDVTGPVTLGALAGDATVAEFQMFTPLGNCSTASTCVEVAVPEPGTYLLVATGFFGLAIVARRRKETFT